MSVSVALCTHNGERFVAEQVRSILAQSRGADELIVSDDASADGTLRVVAETMTDASPELRVLRNDPPLGVTKNFEQAVGASRGDYIALSDQDDVWRPDKLELTAGLLDADPAALLVHTDARLVDEAGVPLGGTLFGRLEVGEAELGLIESGRGIDAVLRRNLATGATVVFRRELLDAALPFPPLWVHDEWLAAIAAALGGLRVLREPTIDYRLHGANQIGVVEPTLRRKIGRVLGEPRGTRNERLGAVFTTLADRLDALGQRVPAQVRAAARAKAAFETARAQLPRARPARLPGVARLARGGGYGRFASQGRLDIVRDLLQPA
ncbi:glycosyltransferase family 2 protein [Gryllotalpicola ginsengisoli]|uniref:glycosyltransferase family 2 protein n=1 Tax=Gryllotalpicola ginsengisoli TaxID=444608 RepID=UPI0003B788C3|nr:glycosyltransferase family 2 protein [Gryllotalpicola ginsengisoli]